MTIFKNTIILFTVFFITQIFYGQENVNLASEIQHSKNIHFKNLDDDRMVKYFMDVYHGFEDIDVLDIVLVEKKFKSSTMQAKPTVSFQTLFGKRKRYKINTNAFVKSTQWRVSELPEDVLKGWFAHEIGHIIDYHSRSNFGMALFGLRYIFSKKFKKQAEHNADVIAVNYGFADDIIAMKRFILENDFVSDQYKNKIEQFYMTIEDIGLLLEEIVSQESSKNASDLK